MNRRAFLGVLAAVPVAAVMPAPKVINWYPDVTWPTPLEFGQPYSFDISITELEFNDRYIRPAVVALWDRIDRQLLAAYSLASEG